ncbi:MAG: 2-oxoglutarate dehydrogenase complex dihydrolipoyllysine-residue succinyltransferase [Phycisphaerae bacterium]|nr:2-oxoglutarate dehydrogenase complex dihydrolipoyllysine-residue succinyltransferase [Phycisphaerae bacterium]
MKEEIKVPSVGESITTGVIVAWLKRSGDSVQDGDNLFELETDKAVLEIPSTGSGTLEILIDEGTEVSIGQTVALLGTGDAAAESSATAQHEAAAAEDQKSDSQVLSPAVRRIVAEHNLDPDAIAGTGKGGRITKEDALGAAEQRKKSGQAAEEAATPAPVPSPAPAPIAAPPSAAPVTSEGQTGAGRRSESVPMSRIRRRTADRLVQATQSSAYLTTFNEIDMQKVIDIRTHYKSQFEKEHGIKIGFMSFFVKASCQALKEFASVNTQIEGNDIIYKYYYDIGVAVSIDEGLIVPNVRGADKLHFAEIEAMIASLAQRARDKKLLPDELTGGTFTITNGGIFGSLLSTPIPAFPQTAILGMHAIKKRPVAIDDQIVIRPMMYVALTYDHRVIDGRDAVGFLARIKEFIESPDKLLLEL